MVINSEILEILNGVVVLYCAVVGCSMIVSKPASKSFGPKYKLVDVVMGGLILAGSVGIVVFRWIL